MERGLDVPLVGWIAVLDVLLFHVVVDHFHEHRAPRELAVEKVQAVLGFRGMQRCVQCVEWYYGDEPTYLRRTRAP